MAADLHYLGWSDSSASAIAPGVAAGIAASQTQSAPAAREMPGWELDDWRHPSTGSTTGLFYQCGHTVEIRLSGNSAANYMKLVLYNQEHERSVFRPATVLASFDNGRTRRLLPLQRDDGTLRRHWWGNWALEFPQKEDFEGAGAITFTIVLLIEKEVNGASATDGSSTAGDSLECEIEATLHRDRNVPVELETYTDYTALELYLEAGSRVLSTGGQQTMSGSDGPLIGIGFAGFPWIRHGFMFEIALENYGSEGLDELGETSEVQDVDQIGAAGLWGGYVFRLYPADWLVLNYSLAASLYVISLSDGDDSTRDPEEIYLGARQRLRLDVPFGRIADGSWFGAGLGVQHLALFDGRFAGLDVSGHALSVTGAIIVAY